MSDDTEGPTETPPPKSPRRPRAPRRNLHAVPGKTDAPAGSPPRKRKPGTFQKGNQVARAAAQRHPAPKDTIAHLHATLLETLAQLAKKRFEMVAVEGAARKSRRQLAMTSGIGNAIANVSRTLMDLYAQYEAGAVVLQLEAQLEELRQLFLQHQQATIQ